MKEMLPKYYIIKEELRKRIESGELSVGSMMPSETEIMNSFSVSRITARRAIDELVTEGYLYKVQGKGSFVKEKQKKQWLSTIQSYTEEIEGLGMNPIRKVLRSVIEPPRDKVIQELQLREGANCFRLERVYYADEVPMCYTETNLPYERFPQIEQLNFEEESLYQVIEKNYAVQIKRAMLTLRAVSAPEKVAMQLKVAVGHPLLYSSAITYGEVDGAEFPIEQFSTYYLTDEFAYQLEQFK